MLLVSLDIVSNSRRCSGLHTRFGIGAAHFLGPGAGMRVNSSLTRGSVSTDCSAHRPDQLPRASPPLTCRIASGTSLKGFLRAFWSRQCLGLPPWRALRQHVRPREPKPGGAEERRCVDQPAPVPGEPGPAAGPDRRTGPTRARSRQVRLTGTTPRGASPGGSSVEVAAAAS